MSQTRQFLYLASLLMPSLMFASKGGAYLSDLSGVPLCSKILLVTNTLAYLNGALMLEENKFHNIDFR